MTALLGVVGRTVARPVGSFWAKVRQRPAASASTAFVVVASIGLIVAMFLSDGFHATNYDLSESSVWVTKAEEGLIGRVNTQIPMQDDVLRVEPAPAAMDIVQDGRSVYEVEAAGGIMRSVDAVAVNLAQQEKSIPPDSTVHIGGGQLVVVAPDGRGWTSEADRFGGVTQESEPDFELGPGGRAAVGPSGAIVTYSPDSGSLNSGLGPTAPKRKVGSVTDAQISVAGDVAVLLDATGKKLYIGAERTVDVAAAGDTQLLQLPSDDADHVIVSGTTGSLSVSVTEGTAKPVAGSVDAAAAAAGAPIAPVRLDRCTYQAWVGALVESVACDGQPTITKRLDELTKEGETLSQRLLFRVNRHNVALNELQHGAVFHTAGDAIVRADDWSEKDGDSPTTTRGDQDGLGNQLDREQQPPVARPDNLGARPARAAILGVLDNDSDANGDPLTITNLTMTNDLGPSTRVSLVQGGQAVQIVPGAETAGKVVSFTYTANDGVADSPPTTVNVTIRTPEQNEPPRLKPDREPKLVMRTNAKASYDALQDWYDPDGDAIVLTGANVVEDAPSGDAVSWLPNGRILFVDAGKDSLEVTKSVRLLVTDTFSPPATTEGALAVQVVPVTKPLVPLARPDFATTVVGASVVIRPLDNDFSGVGGELRLSSIDSEPIAGRGDARYNPADNTVTFVGNTPGAFVFYYKVSDGGPIEAEGAIRVDVVEKGENDLPTAALDVVLMPTGATRTIDLLANDFDPDGDVLAVSSIGNAVNSGVRATLVEHRRLRVELERSLTAPVVITYRLTDGGPVDVEGQALVIMAPASLENQAPIAVDDAAVVRVNDIVTIPVLANDSDPDGDEISLVHDLAEGPSAGLAFVSGATVRYEAPSEPGSYILSYIVKDDSGRANTNTGRVRITVRADSGEGTAPTPLTLEARVLVGATASITIPLTGIDADGDSVVLDGLEAAPNQGRVLTPIGVDSIRYEAYKDAATGTDQFTYRVRDNSANGGKTGVGVVRVLVMARPEKNQPPVAFNDKAVVKPGASVRVPVQVNDFDPDGDAFGFDPTTPIEAPAGITAKVAGTKLEVTAGDADTPPILYRINDGKDPGTGLLSVKIDPNAPNLPPLARDDVIRTVEPADATEQAVDVRENDDDPDGDPTKLDVAIVNPERAPWARVDDAQQVVVELGDTPRVVAYSVSDGESVGIAFVKVPALGKDRNRPPQQKLDAAPIEVVSGEEATILVTDHVFDPDNDTVRLTSGDRVSATHADGNPLVPGGQDPAVQMKFRSAAGFYGQASITFEVTDGVEVTGIPKATLVVSLPITVKPPADVNQVPTFAFTSAIEVEPGEAPKTWDLSEFAEDLDGQPLTFDGFSPTGLTGVDASMTGTVLSASAAADTKPGPAGKVAFTITDGKDFVTPAPTIGITVIPSTRPLPTATEDVFPKADAGKRFEFSAADLLKNDFNPFTDGDLTVVDVVAQPANGTVQRSGDTFTFTPTPRTNGEVTLSYVIQDKLKDVARQDDGEIRISVRDVPDTPAAPKVESVSNETVVLSWPKPEDNGTPITGYTLSWEGDQKECPENACTVDGLTNNKPYFFAVVAHNEVGDSDKGALSPQATPDQRPDTPTVVSLEFDPTQLDGRLVMKWEGVSGDYSPVDDYEITISPAPLTGDAVQHVGTSTEYVWQGLKNGTAYVAQVRAHNASQGAGGSDGWSPPSALTISKDAVPAKVPDKPAMATAQRVDDPVSPMIDVTWKIPPTNGADVLSWSIGVIKDGVNQPPIAITDGKLLTTRVQVAVKSKYRFTVTATNKAGASATSDPSDEKFTYTRPDPMTVAPTATNGNNTVTLAFTDPDSKGLSITRYQVRIDGGEVRTLNGTARTLTLNNGTKYNLDARACNAPGDEYCAATWSPVVQGWPLGPLGPPTLNAVNEGNTVLFTWSPPNTYGRNIRSTTFNGSGVPSSGNHRTDGGCGRDWAATVVMVVDDYPGSVQRSASASSSPCPPPKVTISFSGNVFYPSGCGGGCKRIIGSVENFPANKTVQVSCENGSGSYYTFSFTTTGSGTGGWGANWCWYGYGSTNPTWTIVDGTKSNEIYRSGW